MKFNVFLIPKSEVCNNFIDKTKVVQAKTVVLVPIRLRVNAEEDESELTVAWACSLAEECLFTNCLYSKLKHLNQGLIMGVGSLVSQQ